MTCPVCENDMQNCQCGETIRSQVEEVFSHLPDIEQHYGYFWAPSPDELESIVSLFGHIIAIIKVPKTGKNNMLLFVIKNAQKTGILKVDEKNVLYKTNNFNDFLFLVEELRKSIQWDI